MKQKELEFKRDEAIMALGKLASEEMISPSNEIELRKNKLLSEIQKLDLEIEKVDKENLSNSRNK
jgi:hypothetical protein